MTRQQTTISLPTARADQLRRIAREQGMTVSDLLDGFIRNELDRLGLSEELPGLRVAVVDKDGGRVVSFEADGLPPVVLKPGSARAFARTLVAAAEPGGRRDTVLAFGGRQVFALRKGRGIMLTVSEGDGEAKTMHTRGLTPSLARDLAVVVERAASQADQ